MGYNFKSNYVKNNGDLYFTTAHVTNIWTDKLTYGTSFWYFEHSFY